MLELTATMPDEFVTELQYLIELIYQTEGDEMCESNKRRFVENTFVYDPEYFELKQKYEELCKAVLEGDVAHSHYLAEKGETN